MPTREMVCRKSKVRYDKWNMRHRVRPSNGVTAIHQCNHNGAIVFLTEMKIRYLYEYGFEKNKFFAEKFQLLKDI